MSRRPKKVKNTKEVYNSEAHNKIFITPKLEARTENQKLFLKKIDECTILFASGKAGVGKTILATIKGLLGLLAGHYKQLILIRPAVEAGEHLGFVPGSAEDKISMYMEPMYDCIKEYLTPEQFIAFKKEEKILIKPLAFLRGKTFKNCYVVADEMQNATHQQMKLLVTRIGENSKMIISGDITQIDIKGSNALEEHILTFRDYKGKIGTFEFGPNDSVRHPLINEYLEMIEGKKKENNVSNQPDIKSRK